MSAREKVVGLDSLLKWAEEQRSLGRTIGLANGIFDVLHVGHLRYLEDASILADRLVVAVNSDRAASRLKGPGRPVVPELERAELVAGIWCVDKVTVLDELDMVPLIRALKPEVHVKGTDYTPETVPERAEVESYGGDVAVAGDPKEHSSTETIERIAKLFRAGSKGLGDAGQEG